MAKNEYILLKKCSNHPNVVKFEDNFMLESKILIIMEYCEGGNLRNFLNSQWGRAPEAAVMKMFQQIVSGNASRNHWQYR